MRKNLLFLVFWGALALALVVYWPGLQGGFLFDDAPNLSPIAAYGGIKDWETFKSFVFQGFAGPLGRPIALASFVLDANYWPASPEPFKWTNLCIHLLVAVVLAWATLNLLRFYGVDEQTARWGAVLNMALWMLHPYMVSTTLYVVQRMAQLAALFMFAGLAGYLHGRLLLPRKPRAAYAWMSVSLILGTLLAAFSKENGVLLPLLALVVEWCAPLPGTVNSGVNAMPALRPDWRWRALFLWLPSAAVIGLLAGHLNFSPNLWPTRPFNQLERLLSEARILWEYLFHLYVPRIEGRGLFQDGFQISAGWLAPATTLASALGLAVLLALAVWGRRKSIWGAFFALAVLFFLASHLVESTVIGLELYFEHRNYAASAFLFLPIVMGLLWVAERKSRFVGASALVAVIAMLSGLTWHRARMWADTDALQTYWAIATPDSPRAQNHLAVQIFNRGQPDKALEYLEAASQRLPDSSLLSMQWLLMKVQLRRATEQDFKRVRLLLPHQRFDAQAIAGVRGIAETLARPAARPADRAQALGLLDVMESLPQYRAVPVFTRLVPYLRGLLLLGQGDVGMATTQMLEAIQRYRETDAALSMVADMANAGHPAQAMQLLDAARKVYSAQPEKTLRRSRAVYDMEFQRLDRMLREDMGAQR